MTPCLLSIESRLIDFPPKFHSHTLENERNNSYYFSWANQQKVGTKIYSLTQCSLTVNECDWHILVGNDERINSHCLTRYISINSSFLIHPGWSRVADLRGALPARAPYGPKFSHFHAIFGNIWQNHMLAPLSPRVGAPSYWESWIRPRSRLQYHVYRLLV